MALTYGPGDRVRSLIALGDGEHALPAGSQFTIAELVEPGTPGVHLSTTPVAVLEHTYSAPVLRDGEWVHAEHTRRLSVSHDQFIEHFEPCEDHT